MRQTLLRIPLDADWSLGFLGEYPGFGYGLVLLLWLLLAGLWLYYNRLKISAGNLIVPGVLWCLIAYVIINAPQWVQRTPRSVIQIQTAIIEQQPSTPKVAEHFVARGKAHQSVYEYKQAEADYQAAIEVAPQNDAGYLALAWLKSTCPDPSIRDGNLAIELARKAVDVARLKTALHFDAFAAAYAEAGNFSEAKRFGQAAALNAEASINPAVGQRLNEIRDRLEYYDNEQAYREPRFSQAFPQSLPVRGYGFLMFLGFIAGGLTATRLAKRVGYTPDVVWDLGIWTLFGGIAGARMFYLVQYHERVFGGKSGFDLILAPFELQEGGLVLLGGLLFGSGIFFVYCFYRKLKPLLMADIAVPAFFIALAFGRLGCLMNGCCYGDRCELPWAIQFPLGSVPDMALVIRGFLSPDSVASMPLHPSQIYSSLNALILGILTATYFRYRNRDGAVLAMGMLTYPITRFSIEYLRGDEMGQFGTSFTISQWVSMGLFCAGLVFVFWLSRRPEQVTLETPLQTQKSSTKKQPIPVSAG